MPGLRSPSPHAGRCRAPKSAVADFGICAQVGQVRLAGATGGVRRRRNGNAGCAARRSPPDRPLRERVDLPARGEVRRPSPPTSQNGRNPSLQTGPEGRRGNLSAGVFGSDGARDVAVASGNGSLRRIRRSPLLRTSLNARRDDGVDGGATPSDDGYCPAMTRKDCGGRPCVLLRTAPRARRRHPARRGWGAGCSSFSDMCLVSC